MATPRLVLTVVEAHGVGLRNETDGSLAPADIYCHVRCGDEVVRTHSFAQTTTPVWQYETVFGGRAIDTTTTPAATPLAESTVVFKLFAAGTEQELGEATVEIASLEPNVRKELVVDLHQSSSSDATTGRTSSDATSAGGKLVLDVLFEPDYVAAPIPASGTSALPSLTPMEPTEVIVPKLRAASSSVSSTASPRGAAGAAGGATVDDAPPSLTLSSSSSMGEPTSSPGPANYIVVTILEARELMACDGKGPEALSDPLVKLTCSKNDPQRTKVMEKTLHPKWRQRFYFHLTPARQVLDLVVEDNDMFQNDFMGQCSVDLEQWRAHFQNEKRVIWLALEPKKAAGDVSVSDISPERNMNYGLGKLCLAIEMRRIERSIDSLEEGEQDHVTLVPSSRNPRVGSGRADSPALGPQSSGGAAGGAAAGGGDSSDPSVTLEVPDDDEEDRESVTRETNEDIKKRQEERQKMFAELSNVQILSGDYQIFVRIIEVRDLKPMDVNGLCDPVVSVECLGQRQHTMVKEKQLSCVFDEYLAFNFKDLDKETVQQGSIKVTVLDADGPSMGSRALQRMSSDAIGFFVIDIPYVYFQKDHEVHRKWVALVGSGKTNSDSIQGYLLLSIVVLGPGDKIRIHAPQEEDHCAEDASVTAITSNTDINSLVLIPPRVTQTLSYLVVTIYQAQDLPDMDQGLVRQGGIDGYVRVYFAGQNILETKRVTVKGNNSLTTEFNQELWFPILLPTMSNNIFVSLWDWDLTADELVGNTNPYLFYMVQKYPGLFTPHWTNLYGPPTGYRTEPQARKHMFENPKIASTYRGRVLLSLRIEDGSKSVNDRPHTRNLTAALPQTLTKSYVLRAALFYGTEIPKFVSKTSWSRNSKMSVKISIGRHELKSTRVENRNGICHWNQYLDIPEIQLPADLDTAPDVFVHLVRQQLNETRYICYARFKAKDILQSVDSEYPEQELRKIPQPQWVSLSEDPAMNDLKDHDFTGNVLMNLRLEPSQTTTVAKELAQTWREHAAKNLSYTKYTVFVHVYQAKCLPAADTNGALDPYVKVTCGGAEGKVNMRLATRDPCFYETVALDVELPQDPVFLPKVSVQVFDWDQWDTDDYVGAAKFSLTDFRLLTSSTYNKQRASGEYAPPRPRWYPIAHTKEGDTEGELLLSFELIRKETPGIIIDPPESIRPPMEDRFLEITALGCRGLQPVGFMPMNTPFVKFELGEATRNSNGVRFTNPSSKPSGRNPNFLERVVVPVKMPVDALYAPRLTISVYDQLLGGFYKPLLGTCSVDLRTKMELSNGQPNPLYVASFGDGFGVGNPYVDKPVDFATFPGTLPPTATESEASVTLLGRKLSSATPPEEEDDDGGDQETKTEESDAPKSRHVVRTHRRRGVTPGDNGAGVMPPPFTAAMSAHLPLCATTTTNQTASQMATAAEDDELPPYLHNRALLDGPLEDELGKSPFETFALFRGDMLVRKKFATRNVTSSPDVKAVGKFKGLVRLLKHKDEPPLFDLDQFLAPQPYLVRVYVLDAMHIQPKDDNNKSDPYLRLSLGDGRKRHQLISDRDSHRSATLTPKFHKMYEFKAELPGASELRVEVLDYDFFALPSLPSGLMGLGGMGGNPITHISGSTVMGDDFIGATVVDLEDRWFSQRWQQLGATANAYEKRKPLELRPLFAPFSTLPQGNVRLWVDILTEREMALCKPLDISLPPLRAFEVRVVVYKARNVTPGDFTDLSDLFVKSWLQNKEHKAQLTDTHWRARDCKASFNWRMKFDIELPIEEDNEADKGYLHLQLWDKDVLYDDCLADSVVDLSVFLKQAYRTNTTVNVFAKKKEVRMRTVSSMAAAAAAAPDSVSENNAKAPESSSMQGHSSSDHQYHQEQSATAITIHSESQSQSQSAAPGATGAATGATAAAGGASRPRSPSYQTNDVPPPPSASAVARSNRPRAEKRREKAQSLVKSMKERLGMGDDPEDASWLTFTSRDPHTGDRVRAGELLVSVEILPVAVANMRAAGLGRSEPNNFPVLAEPADRLHLSAMWNPLYVIEAIMGPKYYSAFTSGLLCSLLIALLVFAGPLVNAFVTALDFIPAPYGFIVFIVLVAAVVLSVLYFLFRCRRAIAAYNKE